MSLDFIFQEDFSFIESSETQTKRQIAIEKGIEIQSKFKKNIKKEEKDYIKKEKRKEEQRNRRKIKAVEYKRLAEEGIFKNKKEKIKYEHMLQAKSMKSQYKIFIDMEYSIIMKQKEIVSLISQIGRAYGKNKTKKVTFSYSLFGCNGKIHELLSMNQCYNWKMNFYNEGLNDYLNKNQDIMKRVIYLSPDSEKELEFDNEILINEGFILVIGGIVDKTIIKNLSLSKANELSVKHARLPFSKYEFEKGISEKVALNIDNVIEIVYDYIELMDWNVVLKKSFCPRIKNKIFHNK